MQQVGIVRDAAYPAQRWTLYQAAYIREEAMDSFTWHAFSLFGQKTALLCPQLRIGTS